MPESILWILLCQAERSHSLMQVSDLAEKGQEDTVVVLVDLQQLI